MDEIVIEVERSRNLSGELRTLIAAKHRYGELPDLTLYEHRGVERLRAEAAVGLVSHKW